MPFNLKKLRAALRARNMGQLVVKKRGSPIEPETLIQRLGLRGPESCIVILTKNQGRPVVLIGQPVQGAHGEQAD